MTTTPTIEAAQDQVDETIDATVDESRSAAGQVRDAVGGALDHVPDLLETARSSAEQVVERAPEAIERARVGTQRTTTSLQIGLATGLGLAGAPRLVILAAMAPALLVGGAIATRPAAAGKLAK